MQTLKQQLFKIRYWLSAGLFFAVLNAAADLILPTMMASVVDKGVTAGDIAYLDKMVLIMLGASLAACVVKYCKNICAIESANGYARHMRAALLEKVLSLSSSDVNRLGAATLITRTTNDVSQIANTIDAFVRMMVRIPLTCAGGLILAFALDKEMALMILFVVPVIAAVSTVLLKSTLPRYKKIQTSLDRFNRILQEKLAGVRVIRAFNRVAYERDRLDAVNQELCRVTTATERRIGLLNPLMTLLVNFTIIALVAYAMLRTRSGAVKVGVLIACIQYANQILSSIVQASMLFSRLPRAYVSLVRIGEVMRTQPSVRDAIGARTPRDSALAFEHVSFRFEGAQAAALEDISFTLGRGETMAIIGATGSGKSTILNLIQRNADVTEGRITLGGEDIRRIPQSELRARIGFAPQKTFLFSGSLADNLRVGRSDAGAQDMQTALEAAQAAEFVASFDDGLDHVLSKGGTNLSGGQRQRLAIARALVRKPDIYLFDDSFSALDFKTDALVRQALKSYAKDAAMLIVAQRVGTIMGADRILVLENGRIAGLGTHAQLLETCPVYKQIAASQMNGGDAA